jgi:antitoxin ParD1/3/4
MQIILPPELETLIQRQLDSGKYQTAIEVILAGVILLEQEEDIYQGRLQELQQDAQIGWEVIQRGEFVDGASAMAELRAACKHSPPKTHETKIPLLERLEYLDAVAGIRQGLTELSEGKAVSSLEAPEQLRRNQAIALEDENWSDFDITLLDGLEEDYFDFSPRKAPPNPEN